MRQAINENRTVQLAIVGVLILVVGFIFLKPGKKGGGAATAPTASAPATPATPAAPSGTDVSTAAPAVAGAGASAVPVSLVPGPGLPKGLLAGYHDGDTIVLLVRRAGGIDDSLVHNSVDRLRSISGVDVYVTKAEHIARYAWLTQGVDVTDLPALIVLSPRRVSNGVPTATVSYGFRGPASVVQAVKDARYAGKFRPYHP